MAESGTGVQLRVGLFAAPSCLGCAIYCGRAGGG